MNSDLALVIEAAEQHYRKLLAEAGNYDKLGQKEVVDEYLRDHIRPLKKALDSVRASALG